MPRGDGTGPRGQGPRTGRGMGSCDGYQAPGFANSRSGRGLGLGVGFRTMRRWFSAFSRGVRFGGRGGGRAGRRRR